MPVSLTAKWSVTRSDAHRLHAHAQNDFARVVNLTALPTRFSSTCRSRPGSPSSDLRNVGDDVAGELEAFFGGAERQQLRGVADRLAQIELGVLEVEPPRLDLREVQDVVDDLEQRLGRRLDRRQVLPLLGREPRLQRERRHAEDAVQRRADLVAHVGEERALRFRRLFGPPFRDLQLLDQLRQARGLILELALAGLQLARVARERLFRRLAFGDVARGGVHDLLLTERRRRPHQPAQRAVLVEVAVLEVDDLLATLDLLRRFGNRGLAIVGMDEVHERPRQQLLFAVAEHALPRRIDALEVAVESRRRRACRARA